jgi:diguanylate cyclase (GGDEF)-like protein
VRRAIESRTFQFEGAPLRVTVSGGMAQLLPGDDAATLIRRADEALYASKKAGRNRTHWHDGERCVPLTPTALAPSTTAEKAPQKEAARTPEKEPVRPPETEATRPLETEAARPSEPRVRPVAASAAEEPADDALTSSPEQRGLVEEIRRCLAEGSQADSPLLLSLVLVDVDGLKRLNEVHGTSTGDVVLRAVRQFLTAGLREIDAITRFDGDSFALTLPKASLNHAAQVAERVRNAIGLCKLRVGESEIHFTISVGLAEAAPSDDADVLLLRSGMALQAAKAAGRNRTFYHDGARCEPITEVGQEVQLAMA